MSAKNHGPYKEGDNVQKIYLNLFKKRIVFKFVLEMDQNIFL